MILSKKHLGLLAIGFAAASLISCSKQDEVRSRISIVGSSTVFPFSSIVAEHYAGATGVAVPKIEATGTGGGLKIFCSGTGLSSVDIGNASRPIKKSEYDDCQKNGVKEIIELKIGYDGIVLANAKSGAKLNLSSKDLYLALAKQIPIDGKMVDNPNKMWSDVNPSLPKIKIEVMGPPPTSGTRDAFAELILEKGAEEIPFLKELKEKDKDAFKSASTAVREDGAWKDMGENDNLIVQALANSADTFGVFGYSFFEENKDRVKAATIDNQAPDLDSIKSGEYSASRSLYFYVKKANVSLIPSLKGYLLEFTSDKAIGAKGYVVERGLIPLNSDELAKNAQIAKDLVVMTAPN